ncbi:cytochrome ubiquinol oxidase subunit I [Chromobacterium alticapitis]|uniref:Cytochrome ubiquinol oxidase subunit I n=1 Tax=Chromobacterium alticapitis TaxID=2073169 RepID=A0A2S5DHN0_9NEIS|nr:cytochrome ubiquinol oxidase subunit I [Chromobacterium alticapitis]POZ62596.1 cytochrome ubiquinol oxidase subunit I [Chromobacterium alticapitis]
MDLDPVTLARIQFATNISFHILFPTINIALAWVLLFFKLRFRQTGEQGWMDAYNFWVKIFALSFALGVVSGVTMSFQFGTNWPGYMQTVGNIAGPLLAYEILTAFFLEAGFLGIMLFGRRRVPERVHTLSTLLVAGGNTLSAFWIIALNSWMQTPTGFVMRDGRAHVLSWMEVIFNPSMPYRLTHMLIASGLTVAFLVAGLSAYRYLRGERGRGVMSALKTGVFLAALLIPLQMFVGDMHGLNTLKHQPAKLAAIEGIWQTEKDVPLLLFALPNAETRSNDYAVGVPQLGSLILTHQWGGEIKGLNEFEQHAPVAKVFWSFRVMVGMGMLMLLVSWLAAWKLKSRGELGQGLARALLWMTFSGWVATLAGWFVTEIGRQPWLVTGVLTTAQAAGQATGPMLFTSLTTYLALYAALLAAYISVLFHLARKAGAHDAAGEIQLKEKLA